MKRISVLSSNLKSVGYDNEKQILEIEFQNCSVYQYFNVSQKVYEKLMSAESKGKYFFETIKKYPEFYPYRKIY